MEINALVPELAVTSLARSLVFYCDLLGFQVAYRRDEEGFAFLSLGNAQLMLDEIDNSRAFNINPPVHLFGSGLNLQIRVTQSRYEEMLRFLTANGKKLHVEPEERWYRRDDHELGHNQFVVADPDGYLLRFFVDLGRRTCDP